MSDSISLNCHHYYQAYGVILGANIEIPGLEAEISHVRNPDIQIHMGFIPEDILYLIKSPTAEYYFEPAYDGEESPHIIVNMLAEGKYFHFHYGYGVEFVCDKNATVIWGKWV